MNPSLLDKLMSKKGLYTAFWSIAIVMVVALIVFTANLAKEVPPIPERVVSADGSVLYTYDDVVGGKGNFQQFDLMDYGTLLGMGAYLGPDFSTEFFHRRAEFLYERFAQEEFGVSAAALSDVQRGWIKERVKADFHDGVTLTEGTVTYSAASADAYAANADYLVDFLVNGDKEHAWPGGVIRPEEARSIAAFIDWSQLVASSLRPGTERTWSNNWPPEPLVDQDTGWISHLTSLWELLFLWVGTILVLWIAYEKLLKNDGEPLEKPLVVTKLFPSQEKLLKYVPVVGLFMLLQMILGGYLAHIYTDPASNFIVPQEVMPFNVMRALHVNLAIIWVAIGWLVGGMLIAPMAANEDLKFPWLVDVLWAALLIVGGGGLIGIYMGATGQMRDVWFWLGNEGRELLNLGRVWDIGLVIGLLLWFFMVYSVIRKAKDNNVLIGTIIWSAFGIATLYMAGMAPLHKIMPNYTVDDYYRWWVIHLWVELTFELFAAGVLAFLTVALGLVSRKSAERIMLFELLLIAMSGTLGVGHHYWWQGLDEYWIAVGGIFSALEPLPLGLLMIEAFKQQKDIMRKKGNFPFAVPFLFLAGSAFLNWYGAGFLGLVINLPTINYYSHGTYLIMPHAHVAMLGAFGYISLAFMYLVVRSNAMAKNLEWSDKLSKVGFWLMTVGVLLFSIPTLVIGFEQSRIAHDLGYWAARQHSAIEPLKGWMWSRMVPDGLMIIGAAVIFLDLLKKSFFLKKAA